MTILKNIPFQALFYSMKYISKHITEEKKWINFSWIKKKKMKLFFHVSIFSQFAAMCLLSNDIHDYHYVSQGKVTVPSIDDKEDMQFCHVSFITIVDWIFSNI